MTTPTAETNETTPGRAVAFLAEAQPGDALEALLVEQMAAVHEAAMRCLARAAEVAAEHPEIEARCLREAARLLHLFQRQSDALDRRRIAAEDRAEARDRTERLEARSWRDEAAHAKRLGDPAPPRPPRRGPAWPAWPAPAAGEGAAAADTGKVKANGRAVNGRAAQRRRLN